MHSSSTRFVRWGVLLAGAAWAQAGIAQVAALPIPQPVLPFDYGRDAVSVLDRVRPEYDPIGINAGGVRVRPSLGVGANYLSNVFGAETAERDDFFLTLDPSVEVGAIGSTDDRFVRAVAGAALRRFADETAANETGLFAEANASTPITASSAISGGVLARRRYERQEAGSFPAGALAPIEFAEFAGYVRGRYQGSRVRLLGALDATEFDFADARVAATGARLDQDFRDRKILRGSGRVEVSVTGAASGFVQGSYAVVDHSRRPSLLEPPRRDGDEYGASAGFVLQSGLLRGSIGAGYTRRGFDSPVYRDFGGFAASAELVYFATPITTVTVSATRQIIEGSEELASAAFFTGGYVKVDHELLRNVILTARADYDDLDYRGVDRKDSRTSIYGGARYLMNRNLELTATLGYVDRGSSGIRRGPRFDRFEAGVGVVTRF